MGYKLGHGEVKRLAFRPGQLEERIDNVNEPGNPPKPPCFEGPVDVKKRKDVPGLFQGQPFFSDWGIVTSLSRLSYQEYLVAIEYDRDASKFGFVVVVELFVSGALVDRDFIVFNPLLVPGAPKSSSKS
jgi:hypothetical protein